MLKTLLVGAFALATLSSFAQGHAAAKSCCGPKAACCAKHDKCCAGHEAKKPAMPACCTKHDKCCTHKKGAKPMACCAAHTNKKHGK